MKNLWVWLGLGAAGALWFIRRKEEVPPSPTPIPSPLVTPLPTPASTDYSGVTLTLRDIYGNIIGGLPKARVNKIGKIGAILSTGIFETRGYVLTVTVKNMSYKQLGADTTSRVYVPVTFTVKVTNTFPTGFLVPFLDWTSDYVAQGTNWSDYSFIVPTGYVGQAGQFVVNVFAANGVKAMGPVNSGSFTVLGYTYIYQADVTVA